MSSREDTTVVSRMRALAIGLALSLVVGLGACSSGGGAASEPLPDRPRPLHILIVRHGESWKNVAHAADMTDDDHLTPHGSEEAIAAGRSLEGRGVATIVSSPLGRTRETADLLQKQLGLETAPRLDPAFAPLKEGKRPDGKASDFAWRVEQWKGGSDPRPSDGENLEDGQRRAAAVVGTFVQPGDNKFPIVIVTHGEIVAALLGRAAGTPLPLCWTKHQVPVGSVSEIEVGPDGGWRIVRQGDVAGAAK